MALIFQASQFLSGASRASPTLTTCRLKCRLFALLSLLRQVRLNQRNLGFALDFADFQVSEHGRPSLIAVDALRACSLCNRFEAVGQVIRLTQHYAVLTTILTRL